MKIEYVSVPNSSDIDFLTQKINEETSAKGSAYPFAFFSRDDKDNIIAGCNGSVVFGVIYTDQLWVHASQRNLGIGKKMMQKVHDYGRRERCTMATVATMDFQGARSFYERLGYVCDFERPGYAHNAFCLFLRKVL